MSPAFHASKKARASSTFSCDIARAVSPLQGAMGKAVASGAEGQDWPVPIAALGDRHRVVRFRVDAGRAPCAASVRGLERVSKAKNRSTSERGREDSNPRLLVLENIST